MVAQDPSLRSGPQPSSTASGRGMTWMVVAAAERSHNNPHDSDEGFGVPKPATGRGGERSHHPEGEV